MGRRVGALIRKEFQQLRRDPVLLVLIGWLYTVEVVLCAYALSFDIREASLSVVDLDRTPVTRDLIERMDESPYFEVVGIHAKWRGGRFLLEEEGSLAALRIPPGWTRKLYRGQEADLQLIIDGSNSAVASTVRGYAGQMVRRYALEAVPPDELRASSTPIENRVRIWYNPELRSVYFVFISMVAISAMMVGVVHTAAFMVREKEAGTLDQLMVSPVRVGELFVAKIVPTLAVGVLGLTMSLALSLWFEVPFRGSVLAFYAASLVFLFSSIGIGILIATFSSNLQQALLLSLFGLIPVMFLSGTMVPIENMPRPIQVATLASPLRHYMESLIGVFLKGNGWPILWPQLVVMGGLGLGIVGVSLVLFRRRAA